MKRDAKESSLGPTKRKTFQAVLSRFLEQECPQVGGELTRKLMARKIEELFNRFFPQVSRLRMGQVVWNAVDEKEVCGYGKKIENVELRPVCLDLVKPEDIEKRLHGERKKEIRKQQVKRVFEQAKAQRGVLTYTDVGEMTGLSAATIGKYVREMEQSDGYRLPHRGLIHDMGPTVTHKKAICYKLLVEGKSVETVCRETNHSPEAVTRYVRDYKRIHACLKNDMSVEATAYCTGRSRRLVKEYANLIGEHDPSLTNCFEEF